MKKFSEFICKNKSVVLIISSILLLLSLIGIKLTKVNYDILVYLPSDIETMKGQDILTEDFKMGAYAMVVADNMNGESILKLEDKIRNVSGVNKVVSLYDVVGSTIPIEMLPSDITSHLNSDKSNLLLVTFSGSTSSEETIDAVREIRNLSDDINVGGMSSMVLDTMNLSNSEIAIYIVIAVILCIIVLSISLDSYIVPILLLLNIGVAILYNLGTNIFLGEISYITKALVAVLQLGVTTDFSIFLYHSYENKKHTMDKTLAMESAISETFSSVIGSSLTTIAGFLVLCLMELTLGKDLGIVMAKGVLLGLITVLTLFPALLLTFDKLLEKTSHKIVIKPLTKVNDFVVKHYKVIFIIFLVLLFPLYKANSKVEVYYKMDESLPKTLESIKTNEIIKDKFNIVSPEMILVNKNISNNELNDLTNSIKRVKGINLVLSINDVNSLGVPVEVIPEDLLNIMESDKYKLILVNSTYEVASDELNNQIPIVNDIVKKYDKDSIVAGEGALMKDLIKISDNDFKNVNTWSVISILLILVIILKGLILPILLVLAIEFAIFANLSISYFGGNVLPFVAPITLGTIQLGATIDYAILLTTTYIRNRKNMDKIPAIKETLKYASTSIIVSGMCFFAATFGVGLYSDLEMVGSLCTLISRGAIISMIVVLTVLPSILLIFDKLITKKESGVKMNKKVKLASVVLLSLICLPTSLFALTKDETVFTKLNSDGSTKEVIVNESIINNNELESIEDYTLLSNITNLNSQTSYVKENNYLTWSTKKNNVLYKGTLDSEQPISFKITYKLNGEVKDLNSIIGKSGKVDIIINYTNNSKYLKNINGKNEYIYTPFVVVTATYLDNTINKDITISNGKTIINGNKTFVTGVALPYINKSLNIGDESFNETIISFNTKKFELNSLYVVSSPISISKSKINKFNLSSLYSKLNDLKENMDLIEESSKLLSDGSVTLKSVLKSNIDNLNVDNVLDENKINYIKNNSIKEVSSMYTSEYNKMLSEKVWNEVKVSLENGDETLEEKVTQELVSYLKEVNEYDDYISCEIGKTVLGQGGSMTPEQINSCNVIKNDKALKYFDSLTNMVSSYVAEKVSKEVSVSVSKETAISVASNLSEKLANSITENLINETKTSLNELYVNIDKLSNGLVSLSDGISEYNSEGITKLYQVFINDGKDFESRLSSTLDLGRNYVSFAGNNGEGETKFIYLLDSVKDISKSNNDTKVETKTTFWTRLKKLFK